jgi:hypothetical protein
MSEWKVSMDAIGIALLDSQDMDYNVRLQKDKYDCDLPQGNCTNMSLLQ